MSSWGAIENCTELIPVDRNSVAFCNEGAGTAPSAGYLIMRRLTLVSLVGVLLSGCYESQSQLLDPGQARQPVAASDVLDVRQGTTYHEKVTPRSDGQYEFDQATRDTNGRDGNWSRHTVLVNDLGTIRGHVLYAYGTWDAPENAFVYGILVFKGGNNWKGVAPDCARNALGDYVTREFVVAFRNGAKIVNRSNGVCEFSTPAMLIGALRDFANTDEFWSRANDSD